MLVRPNGSCVLWTTFNRELWGQRLDEQGIPIPNAWCVALQACLADDQSAAAIWASVMLPRRQNSLVGLHVPSGCGPQAFPAQVFHSCKIESDCIDLILHIP